MEPVYKNMQSYPNQRDQMYYGPYYYPGMEAIPTPMHMNPTRPPMGYGCWPWGSNYGYASPVACHGCSNHAYLPAHCAWGSPHSHVAPHPCPGNYPSFPVQYMPPPPFYMMEQPRFEYEKNMPGEHHCCRCPNHPLHQKEQKNVKIEQEEPERERRRNDSLVPIQSKNMPYPIVWLPPDYCNNEEQTKVKNIRDGQYGFHDVKAHENGKIVGQQPSLWNGWFPLDLNNLVSPKNTGDREQNHQNEDGKGDFPFPAFWIPYKPEEKERENHKVKDANTKPSLESEKGPGGEQNTHVNKENIADQVASKARDIPVKEVVQHLGKETSVNQEKERDASVKDRNENGEKKVDNGENASLKEVSKRKSPSPPKSSKLPPVCLRVDPLPRRKNGNGSLQSSSPPSNKPKPDIQSNDARKVLNSSDNKERAEFLYKEPKEGKGTKSIKVVDGRISQGKSMDVKVETPVKLPAKSQDDVPMNQAEEKLKEEHIAQKCAENDAVKNGQSEDAGPARGENDISFGAQEIKADEVKKSCRKELSEEEAAVIIQSAYRGFDVRRWEPVKKLKQIAKVQEQITDVKHLIEAMMSSSDIQGRSKQRNIVAETIMSLLLKLDTIQGQHPSVREVRKSVVRELASLQEQLDTLMNEKSENSPQQESIMRRDEDALNKTEDVILSQNGNETTPAELLEAHQNQIDGVSKNSEIPDANPVGGEAREGIEEAVESAMNECAKSAAEPTIEEDEKCNEVLENDGTIAKENHVDLILGQGSEVSSLQDDSSAKATDVARTDRDTIGSDLAELPLGVLDDFCPQEGGDYVGAEQLDDALIESHFISQPHDTADRDTSQTVQTHEALDLPPYGVDVELKTEETCPVITPMEECATDDKFGTEEVDGKTGDAKIKLDESTAQQLQNFNAEMSEPSEASDEREFPNAEAQTGNDSTCDNLQENARVTNSNSSSVSEEPRNAPTVKEIPSQQATNMIGVEEAAEAKSDDNGSHSAQQRIVSEINDYGEVFEERQSQITDANYSEVETLVDVPQQGEECNSEEPLQIETLEEQGLKDASAHEENVVDKTLVDVSPARDEVTESNRKLIEENERLREMMEKLIKSGQEQLTAISSLSGRVKDLEKKLSRKKKLKLKQYRTPRSGSLCMTKFDGSAEKRTVGVAM